MKGDKIMKRCPLCGNEYEEGSKCPACGILLIDTDTNQAVQIEDDKKKKKMRNRSSVRSSAGGTGGSTRASVPPIVIIGGAALILFILVVIIIIVVARRGMADRTADSYYQSAVVQEEDLYENTEADIEPEEELDLSDVTINAYGYGYVTVEGTVAERSGNLMFDFEGIQNIYLYDADQRARAVEEGISSAVVSGDSVVALDDYVGKEITVDCSIQKEGGEIMLTVLNIAEGAETSGAGENNDYIIPDSNTKLLTQSDIEGLSAQELNYAKNEIYARHGRQFDSAELREYFESKSWYDGRYPAEEFDKNRSASVLSDIEKKNAEFLKNAEYKAQSGGYKLDQ